MQFLTGTEHNKIHEITKRLGDISSPVLRLQAILQYSQIVDILALGDTAQEERERNWEYTNELESELLAYKYPESEVKNEC